MTKSLIRNLLSITLLISLASPTAFAYPYGGGSYSQCAYQTDCPQTNPTSPSPTSPSSSSPPPESPKQAQKSILVNIIDGAVLTERLVDIVISLEDIGAGESSDVGWVAIYIDDNQLDTIYNPNEDGNYSIVWDTHDEPGRVITAVAYDPSGKVLATKDIAVTIAKGNTTISANVRNDNPAGLGAVGEIINKVIPAPVARSFPYWIFALLLLLALRLVWQSIREAVANRRMIGLLNKQRLIAEEKDNFVSLSSHYLHTPLTVMRNGADTMVAMKEITQEGIAPLAEAIESLRVRIDQILEDIQSNKILSGISEPDIRQAAFRGLASPLYWLPVVAVAGVVMLSNFLLGVVGQIDLGATNLLVQLIVFAVVAGFLYGALRTHTLRKREHEKSEQLLNYQHAIDSARNKFIQESTLALRTGLDQAMTAKSQLPQTASLRFVDEGYSRFTDILSKFELVASLQAGTEYGNAETFSLKEAVDQILTNYQEVITSRKIQVSVSDHNVKITQNRMLFNYVLHTVIDNAFKFSADGGNININASKKSGKLQVHVADTGAGIPEDKLPHLFKPFSRADSALQFDYEGLGFSLFLDKIIMDYLDGDIAAASELKKGTTITVTSDIKKAIKAAPAPAPAQATA